MRKSIISLVGIFVAGTVFGQGALTPSSAPSAIMKTLQQVEPRIDIATVAGDANYMHVINSSGSYYLSENMNITGTSGISVNAPNVTIDLNGFTIYSIGTGHGIFAASSAYGLTVRNGFIKDVASGIIYSGLNFVTGGLFEKLQVSGCSIYGIQVGPSSKVIDCRTFNNAIGIYACKNSVVSGCTACNNNGAYAIYARSGSKVSNCTCYSNRVTSSIIYSVAGSVISDCVLYDNKGVYAILAGSGTEVSGCAVCSNRVSSSVVYGSPGSIISDCVLYDNKGVYAINAGNGAKISECTINGNKVKYGINTEYNADISKCVVTYNEGSDSESYGIYVKPGSSVIECLVGNQVNTNTPPTSSHGIGIYASATTIKNCTVQYNRGDGIVALTECNVSENMCRENGRNGDGAGIHVTGSGNRVDSNHLVSNDRGLDIDLSDNILLRNSAHGNATNYDVVGGTIIGISANPTTAGAWDNLEF